MGELEIYPKGYGNVIGCAACISTQFTIRE